MTQLVRRAAAAPGDAELARRLDRALLRAGHDDQVRERYRLEFASPERFEDRPPSQEVCERACGCGGRVRFARSLAELSERVAAGACVAFPERSIPAAYLALARDPRIHSAQDRSHPCVLGTQLRFVDLDVQDRPAVTDLLPAEFAHTYQVVVASYDSKSACLEVACARPEASEVVLDDLRFMLNTEAKLVLADPEAVLRAIERWYPEREVVEFMSVG